jgi:hypothetical protein
MRTVVEISAAPGGAATEIQPPLAPNDSLTVTTRSGPATRIHVTTTAPDYIEGTQDDDKQLRRFQLSEVVKIERREFDGGKTTLLVMAIAVGVFALAKAAAEASLLSGP